MVTINKQEGSIGKDGSFLPVMRTHILKVNKDSGPFKEGDTVKCYVARFHDGQFAVWDIDWRHHNNYKAYSETDLHDTFNELP